MKKKYRVMTPMTVYVLGTLVCFSRFCRAGYLDSCDVSVSYCDGDHVSGARTRGTQRPDAGRSRRAGRPRDHCLCTYLPVELAKVVLDLVLGRSHCCY